MLHFLEPKRQQDPYPYDDYNQAPRPQVQQNRPQAAPKQQVPFDTSNSQFDISGDDLPF